MQTVCHTYDAIAKQFDEAYCKTIYFQKQFDKFVAKLKPSSKIIDIGCGTGHIAKYLSDKGFQVTGIDFSKLMLEIARKRCKNCNFILADIAEFNYGAELYDAAILSFSIIHLKDEEIEKVLKKTYSALKTGSCAFIAVIEGEGEKTIPEPLNPKHALYFHYFTKPQIKAVLENQSFKIVSFDEALLEEENEKQNEFFIVVKK